VYAHHMGRTNIEIDETLVRKARKLTRLKTKREIVDAALELLVRSRAGRASFATMEWDLERRLESDEEEPPRSKMIYR